MTKPSKTDIVRALPPGVRSIVRCALDHGAHLAGSIDPRANEVVRWVRVDGVCDCMSLEFRRGRGWKPTAIGFEWQPELN